MYTPASGGSQPADGKYRARREADRQWILMKVSESYHELGGDHLERINKDQLRGSSSGILGSLFLLNHIHVSEGAILRVCNLGHVSNA
jgi:hypothetical protein